MSVEYLQDQVKKLEKQAEKDLETIRWHQGRNTQLKSDLAKYGGHTAECAARDWKYNTIGKCDCGWDDTKPKPPTDKPTL